MSSDDEISMNDYPYHDRLDSDNQITASMILNNGIRYGSDIEQQVTGIGIRVPSFFTLNYKRHTDFGQRVQPYYGLRVDDPTLYPTPTPFNAHDVNNYFEYLDNYNKVYYMEECTNIKDLDSEVDYSCSVCFRICDNPYKLSCNHSFCRNCISNINNNLCPLCRKNFLYGTIKLNDELKKKIDKVEIKCDNCQEKHSIGFNCITQVLCKKCNQKIDKSKLIVHLIDCKIIKKCKYCANYFNNTYGDDISLHEDNCDKNLYKCPTCKMTTPYRDRWNHTCTLIKCETCKGEYSYMEFAIHEMKCQKKSKKKQMKQEWQYKR